jgi:hypothetical protein
LVAALLTAQLPDHEQGAAHDARLWLLPAAQIAEAAGRGLQAALEFQVHPSVAPGPVPVHALSEVASGQ